MLIRSRTRGRRRGGGRSRPKMPSGAVFLYDWRGAAINGWTNLGTAGSGANLTAIGTNAALTTLDGKRVVDFSGADAGFGCPAAAFTLGSAHTIYVVCRTPSSFAAARRVISGGVGAAGAGSSILQVSTTPRWQVGTTDLSPSAPSVSTWYAICLQYNGSGTDELLYVNNFTTPAQAATAAGASTCTGITVGSHSTGVTDWLGQVAFVAGYSGTQNAANRVKAAKFLKKNLPSLSLTW